MADTVRMGAITWRSLPRSVRRETLGLAKQNRPASSPDIARATAEHLRPRTAVPAQDPTHR